VNSAEMARPWTKLITTFPLDHYDIRTLSLQGSPQASEDRQNYYDGLRATVGLHDATFQEQDA
jgi:hypothetical protein